MYPILPIGPSVAELHELVGLVGALVLGLIGLLNVSYDLNEYHLSPYRDHWRKVLQRDYMILGLAVCSLVAGLYFWAPVLLVVVIRIVFVRLVEGLMIVLGKD